MGLVTMLNNTQIDNLGDDQGPWRQYVLDHLDYIQGKSTTYAIDAQLMNQSRYDLARSLKKHPFNRVKDIAWIVRLLNDMHNDFSFVDPGNYVIPTDALILNLYQSYTTIANNAS